MRRRVGTGMALGCLAHYLHARTPIEAFPSLPSLGVGRVFKGEGCPPVLDTLERHLGNPLRLEGLSRTSRRWPCRRPCG